MLMFLAFRRCALVPVALTLMAAPAAAQSHPGFEGMWSDPPVTAEDTFCAAFCTDAGLDRLRALLDDPANDTRSYTQLSAEADNHQRELYIRPRLTAAALINFPLDPASDPGFLRCEPWGLARQIFARHQLEIRQQGTGRLDMRYGEWDARRTIDMSGRSRPADQRAAAMGHSVGRYEGDTLVIETTGIAPNRASYPAEHGEQLRIVERYTRDGDRLLLSATLEDPWSLREPVVLKKVWRWSPASKIAPYKDCQLPSEYLRGRK
jgi:hypothetical protein